jgi:iron complex transport system ATP-binding protein
VTTPETPACAIAARDVRVERSGRELLSGFELRAQQGEVIALAGPNGAGKSTALKVLAGLWSCEGTVEIQGQPLQTLGLRERARMLAYVPQQSLLSRALLVREVVRQGRYAHDPVWPSLRHASDTEIDRALELTDTLDLAARRWDELSGGEQRRVLLARALATEARIVLLDEPTASLDLAHALRFLHLLRGLAERGHCIVVVLHDLEQVRLCAQRTVLLNRGRSVAAGPTHAVITAEHVREIYGVELLERAALGYRLLDSP